MYLGPVVSLAQILDNRELRAKRQREWVATHSLPLISFTINMPGEVKFNRIAQTAFESGYEEIQQMQHQSSCVFVRREVFISHCGFEALCAVKGMSARELKRLMIYIEDTHPLGRLFDIDVLDEKGLSVSREQLNQPRRQCLICGKDAKICTRTRAHPLPALIDKMSEIINDYNKFSSLAS